MKYNSKAWIKSITIDPSTPNSVVERISMSKTLRLSELQMKIESILATNSKAQEIEIEYCSADSGGMYNVLLPIKESLTTDAPVESNEKIQTITSYTNNLIFGDTNSGELGIVLPEPPKYALSRQEAIQVILSQSLVSQCIELPELNAIVFASFEEKAAVFYIQYGEQFNAGSMAYPSFDMDDGFVSKYGVPKNAKSIFDAMQNYFTEWKNRGYEGSIFPAELTLGFKSAEIKQDISTDLKPNVATTSSIITRGHPLYQPELKNPDSLIRIGISTVDFVNFKEIDDRIVHNDGWMERSPMGADISIPALYAEEILMKLKQHPAITSVDGELTTKGMQSPMFYKTNSESNTN